MMKRHHKLFTLFAVGIASACTSHSEIKANITDPLLDTRWQLVKIEYMDDTTVKPDDPGKYTLAFDANGRVSIKADCNRLNGSYRFAAPSGLEFGTFLSTRAACPPGSLYGKIAADMSLVRSFVIKDGDLHLALMADGGIYHFTPMP